MASAIPQQPPAQLETRPYFCHQCSHQWMKSATALFQCPRCNEGFIEEVTADFQPRPPSPEFPLNFISILNEFSMLSNELNERRGRNSSRRTDSQTSGSSEAGPSTRSRSPPAPNPVPPSRLRLPRGASTPVRNQPPSPQIRVQRAGVAVVIGNTREGNDANNDIRIRFGLGRGGRGGFFTFPIDDVMNTLFAAAAFQHPVMTDNQLQEIPKATITEEDVQGQTQCAICFEDYKLNEEDVRKLPCTHLFHEKCIFPWLKSNATCPVCRARMPNATDDSDNSDVDDVVIGELSRFMENRSREQANRNEESSRANRAQIRPRAFAVDGRSSSRTVRDTPAVRSTSVQTRSTRRDLRTNALSERVRPETRATTTANLATAPNDNSSARNGQPSRRTNLRRVPAMTSLVPPSSSSSSTSSDNNDSNAPSTSSAARSRHITPRPRIFQYFQTLAQGTSALETATAAARRLSEANRRRFSNLADSFDETGPVSTPGVSTRTRSRLHRLENLTSSSSSNSSLVSISSEDVGLNNNGEEPPRRRRRLDSSTSSN